MIGKEILNYTIVSFVGKGGMGSVYLAEHKYVKQQKVAIKVINADMVNDFTRSRLQQEAEALARLNHPNIVHFIDYHIDEAGNIYLIEEYAEGVSLDKYIKEVNGLIVEERICGMFEPILDAMSYAHKMHILHRDLKPSNIIITEDGTPKILDFGIATLMREDAQEEGLIMGTPTYMSPEQVKGEKLDERSDIYSLGVVLFQMLTGVTPYDTTTMSEFEINRHVVEEELPRLKGYYKYISDAVQKVVDKATMKDKAKRYQSCAEFRKALHHAIYPATVSIWVKLAAVIVALLVLGGGYFYWDYTRTKVTYYKDYALKWGVPVGIGKISYGTVQHRELSYRFETKAGKVLSIASVNAQGRLTSHHDTEHTATRYAWVKYYYSSNDNIDYKEIYSKDSVLLYQMDYSDNLRTVTFRRNDQFHTEMDLGAHTTNYTSQDNIFERSRISRHLLTYDENGYVTEKLFAGFQNIKRCDADHIYGIRYKYDEKGRVIEEQFMGIDGRVKGNSFGLAIKEFTYDEMNDWTSVIYLNAERKQAHDGNNCCKVLLEYDEWGNRISEKYYTLNDQPSLRTDLGCYGFSYVINDKGQRVKQTLLGDRFQPIYSKDGYVSFITTYDENGYDTSTQAVDEDDIPVKNISQDNIMSYSMMQFENDDKGNHTVLRAYDENGKLCETNGICEIRVVYDDKYQAVRISYLNAQEEPALFQNYHCTEMEYDSLGQLIAQRFYDANGKLVNSAEGYAEIKWVFDVHGACTQLAYYSSKGTPVLCNDRFAFYEVQYDEQGNCTWSRYFSPKHTSCMTSYGYSAQEYQYDPVTNNEIARIDYDAAGNILTKHHYEYDSRGNITKVYTTDANNKLQKGTTVSNYAYDDLNRMSKEWSTNLSGNRCNFDGCKYAEVRYEYDDNGNTTAIVYFGVNGEPALNSDLVHRRERTYNAMRKITRELNLGIDNKPVSGTNVNPEGTLSYDNYGRQTELACFDGYGKPRLTTDGFHKQTWKYDNRGLVVCIAYYDTKGALTESKEHGYAKKEIDYNEKKLDVENRYFNKKNECVGIECTDYNDRGCWIVWHIYNGKRQYDDSKYNFSKLVVEYDESGIIPVRRMYYRNGKDLLAWQVYNSQKNEWGDYNFGPLTGSTSSSSSSAKKQSQNNNASSSDTQWRKAVSDFNAKCPSVVREESQYTLRVISATIVTDKKVKVSFRTNLSKYEMLESDVKACIYTCKTQIASYRKKWQLPSSVTITFELQDSKNRILN